MSPFLHQARVLNRLVASNQPYVIISQRRGKISEHSTLADALDAWLGVETNGLPLGDWPAMAIWQDGKWTARYRSGRPYE